MADYQIIDQGDTRILVTGSKEYQTVYSKKVIELIIKRKGIERAPLYLSHKEIRTKILKPFFDYLNKNSKNLKVLEVGCSAGYITEYINEQPSIGEVYSYDVDKAFVEITRLQKEELGLNKLKRVDHFTNEMTRNLPYENNYFDVIIVLAVVEHLPYENRHIYIDEYYKKLKLNGFIGFWDTPNRYFPIETHSVGLPLVQWLPPQMAYIYSKLFRKKFRKVSFSEFTRADTGWRNSSYYEILPKTLMIDIKDVSDELGYKLSGNNRLIIKWYLKVFSKLFRVPPSCLSPNLNVVFKKIKDYES